MGSTRQMVVDVVVVEEQEVAVVVAVWWCGQMPGAVGRGQRRTGSWGWSRRRPR